MRSVCWALLILIPSMTFAGEPLSKFGWFADVVGSCWIGTFPDGTTQHSHCYSSQFDHFIRGTATLAIRENGQMVEKFHGDSLFAWDEKAQRIVYYIWSSTGSHSQHEAMYEGDDLTFPIESKEEPGRITSRSIWQRIDRNSFEVRREVPEGEGWKSTLTVLYRRAETK